MFVIAYPVSLGLAIVALAARAPRGKRPKLAARVPKVQKPKLDAVRPDPRVVFFGSAHPRGEPVASLVDGSPVLVEAIEISRRWSSQRIRSTRSAGLWLECKNGERVVIGGDLRVLVDHAPRRRIDPDDPILESLNVPANQRSSSSIAVITIRTGDQLSARGEPYAEHAPELDSYREIGDVMSLRGQPQAPVEVHVVPAAGNGSPTRRIAAWWRRATSRAAGFRRLSGAPRPR